MTLTNIRENGKNTPPNRIKCHQIVLPENTINAIKY